MIESVEYFGGSGDDSAWGIAIDKRGRVFIAGQTSSTDLPGANRGFQRHNRGGIDAFVAQIGGPATYFGGSQKDEAGYDGQNIAINTDGSVWIAGMTYSTDLPAAGSYGEATEMALSQSLRRRLTNYVLHPMQAARREKSARALQLFLVE